MDDLGKQDWVEGGAFAAHLRIVDFNDSVEAHFGWSVVNIPIAGANIHPEWTLGRLLGSIAIVIDAGHR